MINNKAQVNDPDESAKRTNGAKISFTQEVLISLCFLSRIPIRAPTHHTRLSDASRGFGVAGLILGAIIGFILVLVNTAGLGTYPSAIVALAIGVLMTGGLHEDGLADVADGFGGGWTVERKLEIMRDSQIGTYGVLALIFSLAFRIVAYAQIVEKLDSALAIIMVLAAIGCISRAPMALMMYQLQPVRSDGRASQAGSPAHDKVRNGLFISALIGVMFLSFAVPFIAVTMLLISVAMAYFIMERLTKAQIGGHTGDVLGTLQQVGEFACLCALLLFI